MKRKRARVGGELKRSRTQPISTELPPGLCEH